MLRWCAVGSSFKDLPFTAGVQIIRVLLSLLAVDLWIFIALSLENSDQDVLEVTAGFTLNVLLQIPLDF